ncbi:MAG: hypothetical protein ACRCS9_07520 [Hyphomicrobium sp.]
MTTGQIGLALGLAFGLFSYMTLQRLRQKVDKPETRKLLQIVSIIELLTLPVVGYLIGTYFFE